MMERRWWRWGGLVVIGVVAALFASFNAGERVALSFGFRMLYRVPLVPLIFLSFLAGMTTMFLLGLRHDLRVRRALREAGFGEPLAAEEPEPSWPDESTDVYAGQSRREVVMDADREPPPAQADGLPARMEPEPDPPSRYPP
jgi:uncharacterized integral membrane protein